MSLPSAERLHERVWQWRVKRLDLGTCNTSATIARKYRKRLQVGTGRSADVDSVPAFTGIW